MTLSELLIQYREEHKISQREFANRCGVSNGYISMLEKNCNPRTGEPIIPSLSNLNKIAAAMGISIDQLFASVDDMPIAIKKQPRQTPELSEDEQLLIRLFRSVPEEDRALVLQMIRAALSSKGLL